MAQTSVAPLAFRYTCPDCERGGRGWTGLNASNRLFIHLREAHAWTLVEATAEVAEQKAMRDEVSR